MMFRGHKNHYNVELLQGYGASISLKANRICLKDGSDPFTGQVEKESGL
jgi:CRISP-associated protein Cas1